MAARTAGMNRNEEIISLPVSAAKYIDCGLSCLLHFSSDGPMAWNLLLGSLHDPTHSVDSFLCDLKTSASLLAYTAH